MAGVSESTVSRALTNNAAIAETTRVRIQALAREANFTVDPIASGLRSRRSNVICVLISLIHERGQHVSDPFMMAMLGSIADALSDAGYDLLLSKVSEHQDDWIQNVFRSRRPAGALLIGQSLEHRTIEAAARAGLPLVVWGARLPQQSYLTVGSDNREGGLLATRHLLARGRRRIAYLGNERLPEVALRVAGYREAHAQAGLQADPALLVPCGFEPAAAAAAVRQLLQDGVAVDAIVAASDVIAMTAAHVLHAGGIRVPQDVAVVGFDDLEMAAHTSPSLTTVRQEVADGARQMVALLLGQIRGEQAEPVLLPTRLVVRQSA